MNKKEKEFSLEFIKLKQKIVSGKIGMHCYKNAQEVKQIKGLENLEKRLLKAEKRILSDQLQRITLLQNELFPNQSLQERKANFSEFYIDFGQELMQLLLDKLQPLENEFKVIIL